MARMNRIIGICVIAGFLCFPGLDTHAVVMELANDAWQPGDFANYQAGFVSGEIIASRFSVESGSYPVELRSIRVLVGDGTFGSGVTGPFLVHLWEDTGDEAPGPAISDPLSIQLTSGAINEIDLSSLGLAPVESGAIRVGLEFLQNPPPSFYSDDDGFITQHANTIYEINFGWRYAEFFGLTGDWILRLVVDTSDPDPTATPTGSWPTWTPVPTYTPYPTYTPLPTSTPRPTFTPLPTYSPVPTCTPRPTSEPDTGLTVTLWMPAHHFKPGQPFLVNALIENYGTDIPQARFLAILLMAGGSWFYPSWQTTIDSDIRSFPAGETIIPVLPEFNWPDGAGSMENIFFVSLITGMEYHDILSSPDVWIWSFSE